MQPVSILMSNLNVEASAKYAPNAGAAAQDTGQSQEIVREGIRLVQTVQASEAMAKSQRVHRKNENDEREGGGRGGSQEKDSFERSEGKNSHSAQAQQEDAPLIRENVRSKKSFEFLA